MPTLSRRRFLAGAGAALAAGEFLTVPSIGGGSAAWAEDPPFQPSTLFLTWRRDPTTTMMIQWVGTGGETSDTTIRYATASDAERQEEGRRGRRRRWDRQETTTKPYPGTDFQVFRAELSNLTPDTEYAFEIGRNSPRYTFRTMPAEATDTISFVSGGDCGVNEHAVANNVQAARQDPMFAVVGGDLGYDNGTSVDVSLAFLRNYSRHMVTRQGRLIPLVPCIGNHEVDGGFGQPREKAPFFYALFDALFPETGYATLDFGDYLSLVLLDTNHTSPIGGEQTAWLESQLAQRADHPHVMVVNHVPAYPSYRSMDDTGVGNREHWVPLFERYRVPVVLEHHDHTFKRTKPLLGGMAHDNGVLYLGDGSWGRLRAPKTPEELPFLAKSSMDYHLSLHRIEGHERYHMAMDKYGRVMDVCRTGQRICG